MARILALARKTQSAGGIERWSRHVHQMLADLAAIDVRTGDGSRLRQAAFALHPPRGNSPDLIDASDASLAWALRRAPGPRIMRVHGLDMCWPNPIYQRMLRRGLPAIDVVVANSSATAEMARSAGARDVRIIHPPATPLPASSSTPGDRDAIALIGRLVARKDAAGFVRDVWPQLARAGRRLIIVGDGPERSTLRRAIASAPDPAAITWNRAADDAMLADVLARSRLLVMNNRQVPGDHEGFGMVAIEAALAGVPVVAPAVDGIIDAVRPETGILVDALRTPDGMAAAIEKAWARTWDRQAVAAAADRHYGVQRHDEQYGAIVDELLTIGPARLR